MSHPAIVYVEENIKGEDYFIGDVHGRYDLLSQVIAKLKADDRLFMVGDLIDRGPDSYKVLEILMLQSMKDATPKVYSVRGNHEAIFLAFANAREYLASHYPIDTNAFDYNATEYLNELYRQYDTKREDFINKNAERKEIAKAFANLQEKLNDLSESYIKENNLNDLDHEIDLTSDSGFKKANQRMLDDYDAAQASMNTVNKVMPILDNALLQATLAYESYKAKYDAYKQARYHSLRFDNPADFGRPVLWVDQLTEDQLHAASFTISHLPYIITSPHFNVVHADLPFSDMELQKKGETHDFTLSDTEISHATWARLNDSFIVIDSDKKADAADRYTICGHTIGEGLRAFSKHINLDYGAFRSGCLGLFNLKLRTIEIIGDKLQVLQNGKTAEHHSHDLINQIIADDNRDPFFESINK
jgi:hypothetical protein